MKTLSEIRDEYIGPEPTDTPENHIYWKGGKKGFNAATKALLNHPAIVGMANSLGDSDHCLSCQSLTHFKGARSLCRTHETLENFEALKREVEE